MFHFIFRCLPLLPRLVMKSPGQGGDTLVAAALDPALETLQVRDGVLRRYFNSGPKYQAGLKDMYNLVSGISYKY